jgi:opacity protein-like surface antigen
MNSLRQLILVPALVMLMLGSAAAQRHEGYYLGAYFGLPLMDSVEAKDDLGRFNLNADTGQLYALTLGYDLPVEGLLGNGRIELEYNQRSHDISSADFRTGRVAATGSLQVQQLMLNSFAIFPEVGFFAMTPYVGVGIGAAQVKVDQLTVIGQPLLDDESLVFAAQAGCGLQKELTSRLRLDLGYRYAYITDPELTESDGRKVELSVGGHQGMLGLVLLF